MSIFDKLCVIGNLKRRDSKINEMEIDQIDITDFNSLIQCEPNVENAMIGEF